MSRPVWIVTAAALLVMAASLWRYGERDYRPVFARAAGELVRVRDSTGIGRAEDGKILTEVTLVSDTGLEVRLRVRAPGGSSGARHPAALLIGGLETGRKAVDVPPETANLVLASIEYPYDGPKDPTAWQWVKHFGAMRRAILATPSALLLAAQYLYSRGDVDPGKVSIIGVSLGVPFAIAAAATDRRLAGAVLVHGGADIRQMVAFAYADAGPPLVVDAMAFVLAWVLAPLEPGKYADDIAPRPTLMVNATGDEFIAPESVRALYFTVREPKQIVWLKSNHVTSRNDEVVSALMRITLEWMKERGLR